jgi:hypothetical protein
MNSIRIFRLLAGLSAAVWSAGVAMAQTATLTTPSAGYSTAGGSVTLTANIAYPVGSNTVTGIAVTNGGSGYSSAPTVVFSSGGGAAATATISGGVVTGITVTNGGSGYTIAPTLVFFGGGGGGGAVATATVSGGVVTGITVTSGGSGYTSVPTVGFSGGAAATATINGGGVVTGITVTNPGANYVSVPTVTLTGGGGTGATANAIILTPAALGFTVNLPAGWTVNNVGGANVPSIAPNPGDSGQLGFGYFSFPANHATFTVTLDYPPGLTGDQTITSSAEYRSPTTALPVPDIVLTPAPVIASFLAGQATITNGSSTTLTAAFSGGTAVIDHGCSGPNRGADDDDDVHADGDERGGAERDGAGHGHGGAGAGDRELRRRSGDDHEWVEHDVNSRVLRWDGGD